MQPLIKISTIPIKIEAQTKRAALQHSNEPNLTPRPAPAPPPARRARQEAQSQPQPQPQPQPDKRVNQNRNAQRPVVADSAPSYFQEASQAVNSYNQSAAVAGDIAVNEAAAQPAPVEYQAQPVISESVQAATPVPFDYSMDKETFEWNATSKPQLEYVPASIEYSVTQYPDVVIEYVGEPIYVPASSNPNYVPPPGEKGKA